MSPDANVDNGSSGVCNSEKLTFPPAQRIPGASFLNFNALQ